MANQINPPLADRREKAPPDHSGGAFPVWNYRADLLVTG
ncbi:MAG: hypothetical protein QOE53_1399 [Pseudonocardiales bacterium]|jgi:hypothetical protein|nr:hypothetical protein [Pseudonocardiales bacterium]